MLNLVMLKPKNKIKANFTSLTKPLFYSGLAIVLIVSAVIVPRVRADEFDEKINALKQESAQVQANKDQLGAQAASVQDEINRLQGEISALQAQIQANQTKRDELTVKIAEAEAELQRQRDLLGENIKAMYLEGEISTLEMLASSKDLSDFVDKQQYRSSVESKIKSTLEKINALKKQLNDQKTEVEKLLADQQIMQGQLATQQAEQAHILALNQQEQSNLNSQLQANNARISELRSQQAAENAKRFRGYSIIAGNNGNDTYPNAWRNSPQDSLLDNWGMYNRECVSYTAWKVYASGRHMPYWGGVGNANQWPGNARAAGIPVDSVPRAGDVAVAYWGYYGHVMYVESVNANGTINISQYNWDYNGTYSEIYNFSPAGLSFIHF